jgi:two-component system response regulator RegA
MTILQDTTALGHLLIVDDDQPLRDRLGRSMTRKGYEVITCDGLNDTQELLKVKAFQYAVLDLKLKDGYGLDLVHPLKLGNEDVRIVILTGYGNIVTAVAAIKHGAIDYLPKPADAEAIDRSLRSLMIDTPLPPDDPMSPDRVRWEHIQRVLVECGNNVSETARRLKMHRRTLQRMLAKHAPR